MEVKVLGSSLYQWELGRQIKITPHAGASVNRVEFSQALNAEALAVAPNVGNDVIVADIPNILLQNGEPIFVYLVYVDENCLETTASYVLPVIKRPKPADYVYTETEVMTYAALEERITKIEKSGGISNEQIANAIDSYMAEHPITETDPTVPEWAKAASKPAYTAAEVGALPANTKIPTTYETWTFTLADGTVVEKDVALL